MQSRSLNHKLKYFLKPIHKKMVELQGLNRLKSSSAGNMLHIIEGIIALH